MEEKKLYVVVDGPDFAGKTSIVKKIGNDELSNFSFKVYDGLPKGLKMLDHNDKNISPMDRFNYYMEINEKFDEVVRKDLGYNNVIRTRGYLSTIAYHIIMMMQKDENNPYLEKIVLERGSILTPDLTFLITLSEDDLKKRMDERKRKEKGLHALESDPEYLLSVQNEFLRLAEDKKLSPLYGKIIEIKNVQGEFKDTIKTVNDTISKYL